MAIGYARVEFVKRSEGKNACAKSAYNSRSMVEFRGTEFSDPKTYDWSHKEDPAYHEVLLPAGVDQKFKNPEVLWNAAELREVKINSQIAVELLLALPDDNVISIEDRIHLARTFVHMHLVDKGLAAQIDIHPPEKKIQITRNNSELGLFKGMSAQILEETKSRIIIELEDKETAAFNPSDFTGFKEKDHNWHAHILVTTRRFNESGTELGQKARDLMPRVNLGKVISGPDWGKMWAEHQNRFFEEKGLSLRVDFNGIVPQEHLGPVRMRARAFALFEEHNRRLEANALDASSPEKILNEITKRQSVFNREDVDRFIQKHVDHELVSSIREAFWKQEGLVQLLDKENGKFSGKFSSAKVVDEERKILRLAERLITKEAFKVDQRKSNKWSNLLNSEQKYAFDNILQGKRLACIQGFAGTGKSHLLCALRDSYQSSGYTVRAFGPDSATAEVLKQKGFENSENIYRFLFMLHHDRRQVSKGKEIWLLDEAGKLGNGPFLELLKEAEKNRAQVVLAGDYSQFSSVERGGMFKEFCDRYGSQILKEIQRQKDQKHLDIAKNLATGEFGAAINKLCAIEGINWSSNKKQAVEELISKWSNDTASVPQSSTLIIAHTNDEVRFLNEMVRIVRKQRGELNGKEYSCETFHGKIYLCIGDRIQFRKNNNEIGVTNGLSGTLIEADESNFVVSVKDSKGDTRIVAFNPKEYHSYQLGYASTYFGSQGKTVSKAYVLHSPRLNKKMFYVGLTRHVEDVQYFVSKDEVHSISDLKRQSTREDVKEMTISFTTLDEVRVQKEKKQREESIQRFKGSDSFTEKMKGYGLSVYDTALSKTQSFTGRFKDTLADRKFYNPDLSKTTKAKDEVVEIVDQPTVAVGSEERIVDPNSSSASTDQEIQTSNNKTPNISPIDRSTPDRLTPSQVFDKILLNKKERWNLLDPSQQKALTGYFELAEKVSTLREAIDVEIEACSIDVSSSNHFKDWQGNCEKRNAAAYDLTKKITEKELSAILGKNSVVVLKDHASRYQLIMEKKEPGQDIGIEEQLKQNIEPLLFRLFPDGSTSRTRTSFRFGTKGSLSVNHSGNKKGQFYDFEKQEGGGLLKLVQRELGLGRLETKEWAKQFLGFASEIKIPERFSTLSSKVKEESEWISLRPDQHFSPPKLEEIGSKKLHYYFNEVARHTYHDENGQVLFYVLRLIDKSDPNRKITPPLSFGYWKSDPSQPGWNLKGFQGEKSILYNLHLLKERPLAPILIVEGEKTADAAAKLFLEEKFICISWPGGSGAVSKADWTPLIGRNVLIWPDNDKVGFKAGEQVCSELRRVGIKSLQLVNPDSLQKIFPAKWDLADPLPSSINDHSLSNLLKSALHKGIDPQQVINRLSSYDGQDPIAKARVNEVLWRVDERLRPALEQKFGLQFRKIHETILNETTKILIGQEEWKNRLQKNGVGNGAILNRLVYQIGLHEAQNGRAPSPSRIEDMKEIIRDLGFIKQPKNIEKRTLDFSIDRCVTEECQKAHSKREKVGFGERVSSVNEMQVIQGIREDAITRAYFDSQKSISKGKDLNS